MVHIVLTVRLCRPNRNGAHCAAPPRAGIERATSDLVGLGDAELVEGGLVRDHLDPTAAQGCKCWRGVMGQLRAMTPAFNVDAKINQPT